MSSNIIEKRGNDEGDVIHEMAGTVTKPNFKRVRPT